MKSINKLRIVNVAGSVVSMIYAAFVGTWPIVIMNGALVIINTYHPAKEHLQKAKVNNA